MTYSWILFDADGTLFDYDTAEGKALAKTFAYMGLSFAPNYTIVYREINAQIWADFERGKISQLDLRSERFHRLFQAINIESDPHAFSDAYLTNLANASDLFAGALDIVKTLHGMVKLLLITNGIPKVQRSRLAQSPIQEYFDAVIISGEIGVAKPDPAIFDAAFQAMNHPPKSETIIVGDSLTSDIQGGINYEIDTCWFNPGGLPPKPNIAPTYEIQSLEEILSLL